MRDLTIPSFVFAALLAGAILFAGPGCATTGSGTVVEADDQEEVEVGYGTQRKGDVVASVSTVEADEKREKRAASRLSDLLKGDVAGVTVTEGPGGGIMVRIRGESSIYGSSDPLYVVDGTPVHADPGGGLSSVNPYDVESITVLKDAAATSIYGSQGANGVIVVKTKN